MVQKDNNPTALFGYMSQMSHRFERIVKATQAALSGNGMPNKDFTLFRMLELLLESPFCKYDHDPKKTYTQWEPYINQEGNGVQLKPAPKQSE